MSEEKIPQDMSDKILTGPKSTCPLACKLQQRLYNQNAILLEIEYNPHVNEKPKECLNRPFKFKLRSIIHQVNAWTEKSPTTGN